jgi:hypothetical protein
MPAHGASDEDLDRGVFFLCFAAAPADESRTRAMKRGRREHQRGED